MGLPLGFGLVAMLAYNNTFGKKIMHFAEEVIESSSNPMYDVDETADPDNLKPW